MAINPNDLANTAKLTFSDEFNSLNLWDGKSGAWTTGDSWGNPTGFNLGGNGEQQWYINSQYAPTAHIDPWTVSDGVLTITAEPTSAETRALIGDHPYTSGQINTFNTYSQLYGYFEISAKLPEGDGLWPAFWLLPDNNSWPPEIDVLENLGNDMNKFYSTVHTSETGSHTMEGTNTVTADLSADFHRYGVDWQADDITFYFDGKEIFRTETPSDLHTPMYMVANLAVGGYWPGNPTSDTDFPAKMEIDYIRAYSETPEGEAGASVNGGDTIAVAEIAPAETAGSPEPSKSAAPIASLPVIEQAVATDASPAAAPNDVSLQEPALEASQAAANEPVPDGETSAVHLSGTPGVATTDPASNLEPNAPFDFSSIACRGNSDGHGGRSHDRADHGRGFEKFADFGDLLDGIATRKGGCGKGQDHASDEGLFHGFHQSDDQHHHNQHQHHGEFALI